MSLSVWQRNIVTESGDVIPDAEVEVFDAGSSSKPDLFSDPDGNSSLTNPFNADSNGFARFYVSGGRYDIAVNGDVLWEDVALGTTQGRDTGTGADEVPTNAEFGGPTPTEIGRGAIVESDTNANGSYVRWENGEQVCWGTEVDVDFSESAANSSTPWAAEFIEDPSGGNKGSVTSDSTIAEAVGSVSVNHTESNARIQVGLTANTSRNLECYAWGFWK